MAYVDSSFSKIGTNIKLVVRNKEIEAKVAKMPFVPTNYFKPKI